MAFSRRPAKFKRPESMQNKEISQEQLESLRVRVWIICDQAVIHIYNFFCYMLYSHAALFFLYLFDRVKICRLLRLVFVLTSKILLQHTNPLWVYNFNFWTLTHFKHLCNTSISFYLYVFITSLISLLWAYLYK